MSRFHSNMHFRINLPTWYILHKVNMHFTELFQRWRLYIKRNRNTAPICIFSTKINSDTTPICILYRIPILNVMCYLQHAAESPHFHLQPPFSPTIPQHPIPTPTPPIMSNICVCYYINCITHREIAEHALMLVWKNLDCKRPWKGHACRQRTFFKSYNQFGALSVFFVIVTH